MNDEIRKRIDAVRRGEVPDGYIVENHQLRPLDWKYEKIGKYLVAHDEHSNDTERYMLATSSRQGLLPQTDYYNDQRFDETAGGFHVVPEGYVTYRHMSDDDVFKFNVNDLGTPVLVSPEYPVFTTKAELNQRLLIEYLNGTNEFRSFCRAQKKGSTRTRMYFSRLGEFMMPIPPISEQQKIADILSACDRLIALRQNRLEELKQLKKTCLAKMFPRDGADVPELRFPGFTAPWEQRKVSDVANRYDNLRIPVAANLRVPGSTPYYGANGIQDYVDGFTHEGEFVLVAEDGANDLKNYPVKCVNGRIWVNNHAHVLQSKPEIADNKFLAYSISQSDIESLLVGGGRAKLNAEVMMGIDLIMPSLPEQVAIGHYLTRLDDLITLHQRELEAEQQKKKALMQLLLTGLVRVNT